jgi:hypothetical protein
MDVLRWTRDRTVGNVTQIYVLEATGHDHLRRAPVSLLEFACYGRSRINTIIEQAFSELVFDMSLRNSIYTGTDRKMSRRTPANQLDGRGKRAHEPWHLNTLQAHLVAASGEFVGTFFFLFFGYAGHLMVIEQASSVTATPGVIQTIFVGYAYGFSLLVTVWAFYRISGGLFNPAVRPALGVRINHHARRNWVAWKTCSRKVADEMNAGDCWAVRRRRAALGPGGIPRPDAAHRLHVRRRSRECHVPRGSPLRQHASRPRREQGTGALR